MDRKFLDINDTYAYKEALDMSNQVWDIVTNWNFFARDTVGKQLVRSVDSISANLAEGWGRYGKRDKINFYRYSRASVKETQDWLEKAKHRKLVNDEQYNHFLNILQSLPFKINSLIKITQEKLKN